MDAKTISASVALSVAAALGANAITSKAPQELTLKAGATSSDKAVAALAMLSKTVRPMTASKKWAVIEGEQTYAWWCGADTGEVPCPAETAAELDKVSRDGVSATLTPAQVGEEVKYAIKVQEGVAPERPVIDEAQAKLVGLKGAKSDKENPACVLKHK